jgi:predicted transcriptional regulator
VLESETRRQIMEHLRENPGASIHEICDALEANRGTISHHLQVMERCGILDRFSDGRDSRFFVMGETEGVQSQVLALRRARALDIVTAIVERPGIVQKDLTREAKVSRKVLRGHSEVLQREGLMEARRAKGIIRYFPTRLLHALLRLLRVGRRE